MTAEEFSNQFDVLYNNITSNQAPGLTEYEKSVFLTKAQDEIVKNYFLPQSNPKNAGFDDNQKRQIDFSALTTVSSKNVTNKGKFDMRGGTGYITLDSNVMLIINEHLKVTRKSKQVELTVKPISYDEYDRLMSKPYKRPVQYQAWRLINHDSSNTADLIAGPSDTFVSNGYTIRYVRTPKPIIVGDLDGLSIHGYHLENTSGAGTTTNGECELDPILHEEILQRAVELAKVAWTTTGAENLQPVIQAGQRSE